MRTSFFTNHRNLLLVSLWGLIFAKCFILEYFVHIYSVPINSALYVWSLSISMAAAATFVFVRLKAQGRQYSTSLQRNLLIWGLCSLGMLATLAAGFGLNRIPHFAIPACLAVLIGFGYGAHGQMAKNPVYTVSAIGWWIGAAVLFAQNNVNNLLIFAVLIIAFSVAPTALQMYHPAQALKQAERR